MRRFGILVVAFVLASCPVPPPREDACLEPAWDEVSSRWPTAGAALEDSDVYGRAVWFWAHERGSIDGFGAVLATLEYKPGVGSLVRMGAGLLVRQGVKLVPVAGQTIGAAAAATTSFATTYALGRAASAWLYGIAHGTEPDSASLRALYDKALRGARHDAG